MLWAALIIGDVGRDRALEYFRYIASFVNTHQECSNVTLTGISKLTEEKQKLFIKHYTNYSQDINNALRPLLLFPELPAITGWKENLPEPNPEEDWNQIFKGINVTFWHQSQEATDCRWVKVLCRIMGGKCKFPTNMTNILKGISEYPNYDDMGVIRSAIRSFEIALEMPEGIKKESKWAKHFWQYCFKEEGCILEDMTSQEWQLKYKNLEDEGKISRQHYFSEMQVIWLELHKHFYTTIQTSAIDSRHEGAFGLSLYAVSIFIETVDQSTFSPITGRLGLRALVETYITFAYLLQKEKAEEKVWDSYRSYGTGQIKLVYLKLKELKNNVSSIELDKMDFIANEDKHLEFVPINIGHWDSLNLRKMAEEAGLKDLYDTYYSYTSGFIHGNWGAVRESVFQMCKNPLHRFHRVPSSDFTVMPNTTKDALHITNKILDCLSTAYPDFDNRFTETKQDKAKTSENH